MGRTQASQTHTTVVRSPEASSAHILRSGTRSGALLPELHDLLHLPKARCLPCSQTAWTAQVRTSELFVRGPALAMDRMPGLVCFL